MNAVDRRNQPDGVSPEDEPGQGIFDRPLSTVYDGVSTRNGARSCTPSDEEVDFLMELGTALHTFGEPAHALEATLTEIAHRLHLRACFLVTTTALEATFGAFSDRRTHMVRVEAQRIDLGRLRAINAIARRVASGELSLTQSVAQIRAVVEQRPRYATAPWTIVLASVEAAAFVLLLNGSLWESLCAGLLGIIVGVILSVSGRSPRSALLVAFFTAFASSFFAMWLRALGLPIAPYFVTVCSVIILLPGIAFTTSILELATRNLTSGTGRMMGALLVLMQLGAGLTFGGQLATSVFGQLELKPPVEAPPLWAIALAAFAFVYALTRDYRASRSDTHWIVWVGVATYFVYFVAADFWGMQAAMFLSALAAGLGTEIYTRVTLRPMSIVLVPAITALVPGTLGFRSVASLVLDDYSVGIQQAFATGLSGVSLAVGILVVSALFELGQALFPRRTQST